MTGFVLKLIAILTMMIDHLGLVFFPSQFIWRMVGRVAFPIFALSAAEGARYTHDRKRYLLRLLLWAVLSEVPFDLMCYGRLFTLEAQNVCWTLAAGVACCWLAERRDAKGYWGVALLMTACTLLMTDYMFPGMAAIMIIYSNAGKGKRLQGCLIACLVLSVFLGWQELFCLVALLPIALYNGKPGKIRLKYLFYAFYPIHMLIIWAVYTFV